MHASLRPNASVVWWPNGEWMQDGPHAERCMHDVCVGPDALLSTHLHAQQPPPAIRGAAHGIAQAQVASGDAAPGGIGQHWRKWWLQASNRRPPQGSWRTEPSHHVKLMLIYKFKQATQHN